MSQPRALLARTGTVASSGARVESQEGARMAEPGSWLDLTEKPLGTDRGRQLPPENLDRYLAAAPPVEGE